MKNSGKLLLLAFAATLILVGCATATHSWEYRTRTTQQRIGASMLDRYGRSGWELIQFQLIPVVQTDTNRITTTNTEFEYIFKRPKK